MLIWWLAGEVGTAVFRETERSPQMEQWYIFNRKNTWYLVQVEQYIDTSYISKFYKILI